MYSYERVLRTRIWYPQTRYRSWSVRKVQMPTQTPETALNSRLAVSHEENTNKSFKRSNDSDPFLDGTWPRPLLSAFLLFKAQGIFNLIFEPQKRAFEWFLRGLRGYEKARNLRRPSSKATECKSLQGSNFPFVILERLIMAPPCLLLSRPRLWLHQICSSSCSPWNFKV